MQKQLSLKTKFLIPVFTLITILIFLGSMIIVFNYMKIMSLSELNEKILFSNAISNVLHSLQKERGLSSGYVTNKNDKFKNQLIEQRKTTNQCTEKLEEILNKISCQIFKENTEKILIKLEKLKLIRDDVDNHLITSDLLIKQYSAINISLLNIILNIAKSSHIPIITQNLLAYINLLYLKEYAGVERAEGVALLSKKNLDINSLIKFTNLIAVQKHNESIFLKYSSIDIKKYYYEILRQDVFKNIKEIEQSFTNTKQTHLQIKPISWYKLMTKKLNYLDRIGKYIKINTTTKIEKELKEAKLVFILVIVLTILSILVFIIMLIAFFKLAKEEQRLRVVMDKYIINFITDTNGKIIDVSQAFCKISGYTRDELIGKRHNIIRHPDMPKKVFKELWSNLKDGKSWQGKIKNLKKDGSFYWVYANVEPLYDSNGVIDAYISIRLDITQNELLMIKVKEEEEKNKIQEELMQQQHRLAQMGEMISMIAHQWRQPLSAITAATGSINLKAKLNKLDNVTAIKLSDKIKEFSLHLSSTVDDFRNFFKSNKTKNTTNFKIIIENVLFIIESSLKKNNIKLSLEIDNIEEITTYDNELKQVLLNLIKNAEDVLIENGIENPFINIKADKNILTVSDNGGGIPENIKNKIFEPYFSTKLKKDGTGLGLYMSKLIIEDHCGGELSVSNNESGAVFKIELGVKNG